MRMLMIMKKLLSILSIIMSWYLWFYEIDLQLITLMPYCVHVVVVLVGFCSHGTCYHIVSMYIFIHPVVVIILYFKSFTELTFFLKRFNPLCTAFKFHHSESRAKSSKWFKIQYYVNFILELYVWKRFEVFFIMFHSPLDCFFIELNKLHQYKSQ